MNAASHITDDMVRAAREQIGRISGAFLRNEQIRDVLEDAFPEQQPAAFCPLVVTEDDAEEINYAKDIREALQSFVDRHSIKPMSIEEWTAKRNEWVRKYYQCECRDDVDKAFAELCPMTIPEPDVVDAKEAAWIRYRDSRDEISNWTDKEAFEHGYKAAQAGGAK